MYSKLFFVVQRYTFFTVKCKSINKNYTFCCYFWIFSLSLNIKFVNLHVKYYNYDRYRKTYSGTAPG